MPFILKNYHNATPLGPLAAQRHCRIVATAFSKGLGTRNHKPKSCIFVKTHSDEKTYPSNEYHC